MDEFANHLKQVGYSFSDGQPRVRRFGFAFVDAPEGYEVEVIEKPLSDFRGQAEEMMDPVARSFLWAYRGVNHLSANRWH